MSNPENVPDDLPPCSPDIYRDGWTVEVIAGPRGHTIETWVKALAASTGLPIDWHFAGGRAQILVLGDREDCIKVRAAIDASWADLVAAYLACPDNFDEARPEHVIRMSR